MGMLKSGETLDEYLATLVPLADVLLWNCSTPEATTLALVECSKRNIRSGAYANHFEPIPRLWELDSSSAGKGLLGVRNDLGPLEYARYADFWRELGAVV